ncbi:hypothetical protein FQN57_002945 [Myotisia sp. PD_48]|nr:hypothetical protein FQN57_002945 [Myotisia sp. PD_48]
MFLDLKKICQVESIPIVLYQSSELSPRPLREHIKAMDSERLRERYIKFDPVELQREAGAVKGQAVSPDIVKFAEGGFNKVFLLKSGDGQEVIARLSTPIAWPPRYATASEVATLRFLRNVLGIPVPKVLAYSISSGNPVGAEYIIMERVRGESFASRWQSLTTEEVKDVMTQIATMEQKIFSFKFPGYGSLYYKNDVKDDKQIPLGRENIVLVLLLRGSFGKTFVANWISIVVLVTRREKACILDNAKPRARQRFLLPTDYDIHPSEHLSLLSKFLKLAPNILLPEPQQNSPILRHPDLSSPNILLAPGSTKIVSIIDWQDAIIFPLFLRAGYPKFCEHDSSKPQTPKLPTLPANFDTLSPEEQLRARAEFRLEEINLYYTAATGIHNKLHTSALRIPYRAMRHYLFQKTENPWDADLINLRMALVGITKVWSLISPGPCPVSFTEEEENRAIAQSTEWNESEEVLSTIRNDMGIDLEGGTEPENFEWACHRNMEFRMEMLRQVEEGERGICWQNWPYKDEEESTSPPSIGIEP